MKNYLKPYTECTKVESEGHLLAGSPGAGNVPFKPGQPGGGSGQTQNPSTNTPKTTKSFFHSVVGDENYPNIQDGE